MSSSYDNGIPIFGAKKKIRKRIMSIVTDSLPLEAPKDPDACNVFTLYKLFSTAAEQAELAEKYRAGHFGYGHAKQALFEQAHRFFAPKQALYDGYMDDTEQLDKILARGAERARDVAIPVLNRVRRAVGLPSR